MSNKKQTSVEWFFNELQRMQYFIGNDMLEAYKQAKELHKQEIMDAYEVGFSDGWNDVKYDKPKYSDAEQYCKDNYE